MARPTPAPTVAIMLLVAAPAGAAAQWGTPERPPLPDPLAVIRENGRLELVPAFGMAAGDTEMAFRASLSLATEATRRFGWSGRAVAIGVRGPAHTWAGAEAAIRGSIRHGAFRSWLETAVFGGAGDAAARAFRITAGAGTGHVSLVMRSTWWDGQPAGRDSIVPGPGTGSPRLDPDRTVSSRYDEAEVTALQQFGRFEATANAGVRFGEAADPTPPWAALQLVTPLRGNLDIYLAGGRRPDRPEVGQLPGTFVMLGMRLRPSQSTALGGGAAPPPRPAPPEPFAVYRIDEEAWVLTIHAPAARIVEIAADFTDWEPVQLEGAPGETAFWRETFHLRAGLHHIAVRIDGGDWTAPPGLPVVPDGFGGEVGLLELR